MRADEVTVRRYPYPPTIPARALLGKSRISPPSETAASTLLIVVLRLPLRMSTVPSRTIVAFTWAPE